MFLQGMLEKHLHTLFLLEWLGRVYGNMRKIEEQNCQFRPLQRVIRVRLRVTGYRV